MVGTISRSMSRNTLYNIHESYISVGLSKCLGISVLLIFGIINEVEYAVGYIQLLFLVIGVIGIWSYGLSWLCDLWLETFGKMTGLEMRMILSAMKWLIFSELMLFVGCFWALINFRLVTWGLYFIFYFPLFSFNALSIPFSNLMILLYSTLPCQSLLLFIKVGLLDYTLDGIGQTILCGLLFITLQSIEFLFSLYTISDLIVGSVFYFTTSIHGLHVIIGSIGWLIILLNGIESYSFSSSQIGTHSSNASGLVRSIGDSSPSFFLSIALSPFLWSYYWHFVDLIWLIVFMLLVL